MGEMLCLAYNICGWRKGFRSFAELGAPHGTAIYRALRLPAFNGGGSVVRDGKSQAWIVASARDYHRGQRRKLSAERLGLERYHRW